jgi:hypothetical protein
MLSHRYSAALGLGLLLVAVSAFGQVTTTTVEYPLPSPQLPPVGLAATETAQVNIVNTAPPSPLGGVQPYCVGAIVFYGGAGGETTLGPIGAFAVESGKMFSVALPYAAVGASGSRTVVRVAITLGGAMATTARGSELAPCIIASSLETYDTATGVTHAFASGITTQGPAGVARQAQPVAP